ncbi:MAG: hypothetical protein ABEI74_04420 [Candidatus Pacearchaeota archaeon]
MKREILNFIDENGLSPLSRGKSSLKSKGKSVFKTPDARKIHREVVSLVSKKFVFPETSNVFNYFEFSQSVEVVNQRQEFFKALKKRGRFENGFLKELSKPSATWRPDYDVVVVTENSETFNELKKKGCPAQLILSDQDVASLEGRDIVQVLDCDESQMALEQLPQSVFLRSIDEAYLERYLEDVSGWGENLKILKDYVRDEDLKSLVEDLYPLLELTKSSDKEGLSFDGVKEKVSEINDRVTQKAKDLSVSGDSLVSMLNKGELPKEIKDLVLHEIKKEGIPEEVVNLEIPLSVDEQELEKIITKQDREKFSNKAEKVKENADKLKKVPEKLGKLSNLLVFYDFVTGISQFVENKDSFPEISEDLDLSESENLLLDSPQPISFHLDQENRASILTGANSGGKTTLMEHVLQVVSLLYLGLPAKGKAKVPLFASVYYFAKNKGAISKGAFENLLDQMSKISPAEEGKTLILADEIESVTEPGVAGKIIAATADYFIKRNCYLIVATHLGHEIQYSLPEKTRIDGIEAKGLNENFELVVNHDPVKGRLANSTPELIVERMANYFQEDYFRHLDEFMKSQKG